MRFFALLAAGALSFAALAQDWPAKPVRIIVPFPAGGSADLMPRILGEKLSEKWGQPVVVENRAGAAGNIGAEYVYRAEPDGYTLLSSSPPPLAINRLLYPKLGFDSTQFVPMSVMAAIPNVLLVHPKVPANSVEELIAYAKANPGKLNYASQGNGTTSHLTAELFKQRAGGLQIAHIPYKGTAPALTDLLGGQVDMMCDNLGVSLPHVRSGKLKALAVASAKRIASQPGVPALAETFPGFEAVAWFAIVGPPRTPSAIAEKVGADVREALKLPEVQKRLAELSAEPMGLGPADTGAFIRQETERWGAVIRTAGVKLE
ncbi:MAG: tripartite tricarboxylate transporter substrate binding protein [Betaproteobacteria bacterium]|nr:MAG: tripartite tricarboxylate transporter substrate binding protein [Betaproteobacteria bacterium]